jgi:hypothetical protein
MEIYLLVSFMHINYKPLYKLKAKVTSRQLFQSEDARDEVLARGFCQTDIQAYPR